MNFGRSLFASALVAIVLAPGSAQARVVIDEGGSIAAQDRRAVGLVSKARSATMKSDSLVKEIEKRKAKKAEEPAASNGFVWPVVGAINTPFSGGHAGIDIEGVTGDEIIAAQSGTVTFAGDDGDGYGVKVVIQHANGYETLYSHLSAVAVSKGDIAQGDLVGYVGCTGSCTGDHLHFEIIRSGAVIDPVALLP